MAFINFLLLALMAVFAFFAIQTASLRRAVIYLSVYSLVCSLIYLFYGAADVAIAEAVIGCTLSTILYLVALKKYQIFTVYYIMNAEQPDNLPALHQLRRKTKSSLTNFTNDLEFQLDFVTTQLPLETIFREKSFDLIILHSEQQLDFYGISNNYHYDELKPFIQQDLKMPIIFHEIEEGSQDIYAS